MPLTLVFDYGFIRVAVKAVGMRGGRSCEEEDRAGVWSLALWAGNPSFAFMDALCQVKDFSCKSKIPGLPR